MADVTTTEAGAVAMTGVLGGGMAMVIGQVDAVSQIAPNNVVQMLGGLTSLGFTVWYCWYNEAYAKPARDKIHADTIDKIVQDFREDAKEQRAATKETVERVSVAFEKAVSNK
jgi:hypothetical protein